MHIEYESSMYQIYNYLVSDIIYSFILSCADNLKTWKAAWKRKYDCMLLPCHVRVFECMYTRYLTDCQGTPSWKQARSLSDTMEFKVWLNGGVFIYELSSCGFESRCCHTLNMKKYLDPWRGSSFGPLSFFFFQHSLQKHTAAMNRNK